MIYTTAVLGVILLGLAQSVEGFKPTPLCISCSSRGHSTLKATTIIDNTDIEEGERPLVTVRFINTVTGKDVVTVVEQGSNLLFIGDQAGVKLPRSCRTGLCASCTCEVMDPMAIATASNPRDGFATIRACSTKCYVPPGMEEMVVDVYRMQNRAPVKSRGSVTSNAGVAEAAFEAYVCANWLILCLNLLLAPN